jgi:hypothetical protein
MDERPLKDLEYCAEFERHQFALYDTRRLSAETHANAVAAAALAVAAFVFNDYGREEAVGLGWLVAALVGLGWAFLLANLARVLSWLTPAWRGGENRVPRPSDVVAETLDVARERENKDSAALRQDAIAHWQARAESAWRLGAIKGKRLNLSLWGFVGPLVYFAARLLC